MRNEYGWPGFALFAGWFSNQVSSLTLVEVVGLVAAVVSVVGVLGNLWIQRQRLRIDRRKAWSGERVHEQDKES